jgi:hypothetical protein
VWQLHVYVVAPVSTHMPAVASHSCVPPWRHGCGVGAGVGATVGADVGAGVGADVMSRHSCALVGGWWGELSW